MVEERDLAFHEMDKFAEIYLRQFVLKCLCLNSLKATLPWLVLLPMSRLSSSSLYSLWQVMRQTLYIMLSKYLFVYILAVWRNVSAFEVSPENREQTVFSLDWIYSNERRRLSLSVSHCRHNCVRSIHDRLHETTKQQSDFKEEGSAGAMFGR